MINFNSGTRSASKEPFGLNAWRRSSRHLLNSASGLLKKRADKAPESLRHSGVGDVAVVLIELAEYK